MRLLLSFTLALSLLAQSELVMVSVGSSKAITLLSHTSASGQNTTTSSSIDTRGAKYIWIGLSYYFQTGNSCVITSTPSNTFTQGASYNGGTATVGVTSFYVFSPVVSATQTFTMTGTNCYVVFNVIAFSGLFINGVVEGANGTYSGGGTSIQTGTTGTLTNSPYEVCTTQISENGTITALTIDSSFATPLDYIAYTGGVNEGGAASYKILTANTALNPKWSWTTTSGEVASGISCAK